MNPCYGDFDTYWMAASAIDEAVRNCVAVGADPSRIAILDNFCWGTTDRPETLGSLVRAALACHDVATGAWARRLSAARTASTTSSARWKRGQVQFAGTARRVLRTNWTYPLFQPRPRADLDPAFAVD